MRWIVIVLVLAGAGYAGVQWYTAKMVADAKTPTFKAKAPPVDPNAKHYYLNGMEISEEAHNRLESEGKDAETLALDEKNSKDGADPINPRMSRKAYELQLKRTQEVEQQTEASRTYGSGQVVVSRKSRQSPAPDAGPTVVLRIPAKPKNALEAFYYKQTVGEVLRLTKEPKASDQIALDMLAKWSHLQAMGYDNPCEICAMWAQVPQRQPVADFIFESCESKVFDGYNYFFSMGVRFVQNDKVLEKEGYSAYLRFVSRAKCAHEIARYFDKQPAKLDEARDFAGRAVELLPEVLTDPEFKAEALEPVLEDLAEVYFRLDQDSEAGLRKVVTIVEAKRPDLAPYAKGYALNKTLGFASGQTMRQTPANAQKFSAMTAESRAALEAAWKKEPSANIATQMETVCLAEQKMDEVEVWYNRGLNLNPESYELRLNKIEALILYEGGSPNAMLAFSRECVARYKKDPTTNYKNVMILCVAEDALVPISAVGYLAQPEVYAEIKDALEAVLKQRPDAEDVLADLMYYADQAGDFKTVASAFERIKVVRPTMHFSDERYMYVAADRAKKMLAPK